MNKNVIRYKDFLFSLNIVQLIYIGLTGIIVLFIKEKINIDTTPAKFILVVYLGLFPVISFNIFFFILVILNKITYRQYNAMNYINEFIYFYDVQTLHKCGEDDPYYCEDYYTYEHINNFDDLISNNNKLFVFYSIGLVLTILYPILITSIFGCGCSKSDKYGEIIQKLNQCNEIDNTDTSDEIYRKFELQGTSTL